MPLLLLPPFLWWWFVVVCWSRLSTHSPKKKHTKKHGPETQTHLEPRLPSGHVCTRQDGGSRVLTCRGGGSHVCTRQGGGSGGGHVEMVW